MLLLSALLTPDLGLIFWTTIAFLILWTLLGRTAWKPIMSALKTREENIEGSLKEAEKAREEMAALKADHLQLLNEAKEERVQIIKEAKEIRLKMISEAEEDARTTAAKIVEDAKNSIHNEKMAAITEVKNLIGSSAISLTEQVLGRELNDKSSHQQYIETEVKKLNLN